MKALLTDRWVVAAATAVTIFQLLYAFLAHPHFNADGYLDLGLDFGKYWHYAQFGDTMRTPGYPLLLAAVFESGLGATGLKIVQTAFMTAGLLGLTAVAELTAGRVAARICAWLFALYIPLWSYSSIVRTEAIAIPLLIFALLALLLSERSDRNRGLWTAATGAMCGLALIVRPNCVSAVAIFAAVLLWQAQRRSDLRECARLALLFALPIVVIFTPWVARNLTHEGSPDPLGHNPFPLPLGIHMPYERSIGPFASYDRSHTFFGQERADGFTPEQALASDSWQVLKEDLKSHTREFLETRAVAEFQMWPWPATPLVDYGDDSVIPYPLIMAMHLFVLFAGLAGLFALRRNPVGMIGLAFVAMLFVIHLLYVALPRYNLPAMPFLLVGAAVLLAGRRRGDATVPQGGGAIRHPAAQGSSLTTTPAGVSFVTTALAPTTASSPT